MHHGSDGSVAQLDRATGFYPVSRRFESCYSHCAGVAQLAEQGTCNAQVVGSTPSSSL